MKLIIGFIKGIFYGVAFAAFIFSFLGICVFLTQLLESYIAVDPFILFIIIIIILTVGFTTALIEYLD